jgi:hypothetical protein
VEQGVRARIDSLVWLIRRWPRGAARAPLDDWARHFELDPLLVRRIVQAQGISLDDEAEETDEEVDPNQTTSVMRTAELGDLDADPDPGDTAQGERED